MILISCIRLEKAIIWKRIMKKQSGILKKHWAMT